MKKGIIALITGVLVLLGCQVELTPEQQALVDKSNAALKAAADQVAVVQTTVDGYIAEYKTIKAKIDSGESIPAILASRFAELTALIKGGVADIQTSVAKVTDAKKALEEAMNAGVKWYNSQILINIVLLLCGAAGVYFPVAAPAIAAIKTVVQAVAVVNKVNPAAGALVKKAVLTQSREVGDNELSVDSYIQRYDPKIKA